MKAVLVMYPLFVLTIALLFFVGTTTSQSTTTSTSTSTSTSTTSSTTLTYGAPLVVGMVNDEFLKYAAQDNQIYNASVWWANWVNKNGGLVYDGQAHNVTVIGLDSSTPNPALVDQRVSEACEDLVSTYNIDLMLAPATTDRANASMQVSEKYKIINLVAGASSAALFKSTNSYVFSSASPASATSSVSFDLLIQKGAKTYVILTRPDSIAVTQGTAAISYLNGKGLTMVKWIWLNSTATDLSSLDSDLRSCITNNLQGVVADIFIYASLQSEFPAIATVLQEFNPVGIKSAVFLVGCTRYEQQFETLGQTGDYWVSGSRFDVSFNLGVSGQYGGTSQEFTDDFTNEMGIPPSLFDGIAAGLLMGYYRAVMMSNSKNASVVRATMKNMTEFDTFAFKLKFQANGTNEFPMFIPIQYVNGEGQPITIDNIIYPAQWTVPIAKEKGVDIKKIVAIAVPIGLAVLVAVAIGIIYIRRQRQHVVQALEEAEEGERRNYKIDYSALSIGSLIGAGGFGYVYKGEYRGADVAVKKLKSHVMSPDQLDQFAKESSVMIGLRHPNILLFMGVCATPPDLCIITEFCQRGSLHEIIHNDKINLPLPLIKNMVEDTLRGLIFIHAAGFIHRDFKSPNLLVDRNWGIKISDFGLSCLKSKSVNDAQVSLLWTAPEILSNQKDCYSEKSDIYAFGIVLWEMLARATPYSTLSAAAISTAVVRGERPPVSLTWDKTLSTLMTKCWDANPNNRCSVKEARTLIESMYIDPDFEIGSSSTITKYVEKVPPPTGSVTFVNTTMSDVVELWEHDPRVMQKSLILHNELLRSLMVSHRGYEVKSNGDSFMIAFPDPSQAISFCLRAQSELLNVDWPESLTRHVAAKEERSQGTVIFRGLSIRMGIHTTNPTPEKNQETGKMDYSGPGVTRASLMAAIASKGRIMVDSGLYSKAMASIAHLDPFVMQSVGPVLLTKSTNPFDVYEMVPEALKERMNTKEWRDEVTPSGDSLPADGGRFEFAPYADRWILNYSDFQIGEKIGAGSFGEVRSGLLRGGERVAIKELIKQKVSDDTILELRAESAFLSMLQHANVLQFKGMCLKEPHLCIVTEFMEKGCLSDLLYGTHAVANIPWDVKKRMAIDIAKGLGYLHGKGIIHRDVKSGNMLVNSEMRVKIADFGFSRMKAENQTMTQCGTVAWTAPEIFEGSHYSEQADVYSFGIILWEMIFRTKPWMNVHSMRVTQSVIGGKRPPITNLPPNTPTKLVSIMESCWAQTPQHRPTFEEVVEELNEL